MNIIRFNIVILVALICQITTAQITGEANVLDRDIFYANYTTTSTKDYDYERFSTKLGLPPIRLNKLSLYNTIGMDVHDFNYTKNHPFEDASEFERFYNINYSLFSNCKLSDKWSVNALGNFFINANLENKISGSDIQFNGNAYLERTFLRKKGGYFLLDVGVAYMTLNGATKLSPLINVKARLNQHWSFVLGLPNTYVKWDINKKHSFKMVLDLNDFSANINSSALTNNLHNTDKIVFTTASTGLEYNYWIMPSLGVMLRANYPVWNNHEFRNIDNDAVYKFDSDFEQPFINIGIKFNPLRRLQNGLNPF